MDLRLEQLKKWLEQQFKGAPFTIAPVSGDASFRRYFRIDRPQSTTSAAQQWIAMDAPPEKEDSRPFVSIARHWSSLGIQVPHIEAVDLTQGFMLLDDFGNTLLLDAVNKKTDQAASLYGAALTTLTQIQSCSAPFDYPLPPYDDALLAREMELFREWLVAKKLGISLSKEDHARLDKAFQFLTEEALSQPVVCVHRDYHSRNLMTLNDQSIGVIDFQDAVMGPITYDAVSLLRDCYIVLPDDFIDQHLTGFHQATLNAGLHHAEFSQFKRWFDLMGIQRHLKAAGIFARLSLRDGKHDYLNDVPRTVQYIERISSDYEPLSDFNQWLNETVIPEIQRQQMPSSDRAQPATANQGI